MKKWKKHFPANSKTLLYIGFGAGLNIIGLAPSNQASIARAALAAAAIGYGTLVLKFICNRFLYFFTASNL